MAGLAALLRAMEFGLHTCGRKSCVFCPGTLWVASVSSIVPTSNSISSGTNPAGGQSTQAIGRTKGGLNTKVCALVEGHGRLVSAVVTPGQMYEVEAATPLLKTLKNVLLVGDKGLIQMLCAKNFWLRAVSLVSRHEWADAILLGITKDLPPEAQNRKLLPADQNS